MHTLPNGWFHHRRISFSIWRWVMRFYFRSTRTDQIRNCSSLAWANGNMSFSISSAQMTKILMPRCCSDCPPLPQMGSFLTCLGGCSGSECSSIYDPRFILRSHACLFGANSKETWNDGGMGRNPRSSLLPWSGFLWRKNWSDRCCLNFLFLAVAAMRFRCSCIVVMTVCRMATAGRGDYVIVNIPYGMMNMSQKWFNVLLRIICRQANFIHLLVVVTICDRAPIAIVGGCAILERGLPREPNACGICVWSVACSCCCSADRSRIKSW